MTKNFKSLIAIIFLSLFLSCRTIKVFDYLKVTENEVQTYNSFWVIGGEEMVRKVPAPKLPEGMAPSVDYGSFDTVYASFKVIYKHIIVDGEKIVYALSAEDTMRSNPSVGPNHFLSSAMIFKKNSLLLAPIYRLEEISKLDLSDFNTKIPHKIFKKDSIIVLNQILFKSPSVLCRAPRRHF